MELVICDSVLTIEGMQLGFIGLGKMGKNMVYRLLDNGIKPVVWNRSPDDVAEVSQRGAIPAQTHAELVSLLTAPRIVWVMVPQGQPVTDMINSLLPLLQPGDLLIDGGNSNYKDTLARSAEIASHQIRFMDIGVSGGPGGARSGACLMVGGAESDYQAIEPLLKILAAPDSYAHLGPVGAGHFAKMVHNGIEYGMMQAIAEGAAVLEKSDFHFDLAKVFSLYNRRSVIESRLVEWATDAFKQDPTLSEISSQIAATGEGEWTVNTACDLGIDVPVITKSLDIRKQSATEPENFRNKVVSALRGQFGGHPVKKVEASK